MKAAKVIPFLLILLLVLSESFFLSPVYQPPEKSREVFRYIGMALTQGQVPYRDVFDHKPPLIYFICALTDCMGPWGLWIFNTTAVFVCSLIAYRVLSRYSARYALGCVFLFILLIRYLPIIDGGGLTREITCYLAYTLIVCIIFSEQNRNFTYGVIAALIFFTQQNELLAVLPFLIYNLIGPEKKGLANLSNRGLKMATGFSVVTLILTGFFFFHNAINDFWKSAFEYNTQFYIHSEYTFKARIAEVINILNRFGFILPIVLFAFPALVALFVKRHIGREWMALLACFAGMGIEIYSIAMSGRNYSHYFLGFIPFFCLLPSLVLRITEGLPYKNAFIQRVLALILLFSIIRFSDLKKWTSLKVDPNKNRYYENLPLNFVSEVNGQAGKIFVFRLTKMLAVNVEMRSTSPTKWIYTQMWDDYKGWDRNGTLFKGIIQDIKKNKTKFILDYSNSYPMKRKDLQETWNEFISENYVLLKYLPDKGNTYPGRLYGIRE